MNDVAVTAYTFRCQPLRVLGAWCLVLGAVLGAARWVLGGCSISSRRPTHPAPAPSAKHQARSTPSEVDLHISRRRDMDAVDEPDAVRIVLHDHRARPGAVSEESDPLHQRTVGDAGRGENDPLARREILR